MALETLLGEPGLALRPELWPASTRALPPGAGAVYSANTSPGPWLLLDCGGVTRVGLASIRRFGHQFCRLAAQAVAARLVGGAPPQASRVPCLGAWFWDLQCPQLGPDFRT